MLGLFGLLFIGALIPAFGNELSTKTGSFGSVLGFLSALCVTFAMLGIWVGAIWHAAVHTRFVSEAQRVTVILILLVGSVLAGLGYYFGYVRWVPLGQQSAAAV